MRQHPGFSIVELLVVIAIVGLLTALILPAIESAREAARRSACSNNLRQLGIGLTSYDDAARHFPAMVIWSPAGEPQGMGLVPIGVIDRIAKHSGADTIYANWLIALLPFLEEQSTYDAFDLKQPMSAYANQTPRTLSIATFNCPSDFYNRADNQFERGLAAGYGGNQYARGNFAINVGPDRLCIRPGTLAEPCFDGFTAPGNLLKNNSQLWGSGIAGVNRTFAPAAIKDGLSHTIAVVEIRAGIDPLDPRGVWSLGQVGSSATARNGKFEGASRPNHLNPSEEFIGCTKLTEKYSEEGLLNLEMPCSVPQSLTLEGNAQQTARSLHRYGVNVMLCDGSVRFIEDEVDILVWHGMNTRDGGEGH